MAYLPILGTGGLLGSVLGLDEPPKPKRKRKQDTRLAKDNEAYWQFVSQIWVANKGAFILPENTWTGEQPTWH